ncbi:hypothetical protein [Pontibacterium sp.]|uniref:hypothetical protein n=1 Tax=Pontibacterium sp. TaxID=2036026 RepID=UPI00356202B7
MEVHIIDGKEYALNPLTGNAWKAGEWDGFDAAVFAHRQAAQATLLAAKKKPLSISKTQFVKLCQGAGGMTNAMLTQSYSDPDLSALWIKISLADGLDKDDEDVEEGVFELERLGYLPAGAASIFDSWPSKAEQ